VKREEERGRSQERNQKTLYVFDGPALKEKLQDNKRSTEKKQEAGSESAPGKIRSRQSWSFDGRSDDLKYLGQRGGCLCARKLVGIVGEISMLLHAEVSTILCSIKKYNLIDT